MKLATRLILSCACVVFAACEHDDIGEPCHPQSTATFPSETITGEEPVLEVVSMQRSIECETFQCLSYGGYEAFCTRTCAYNGKRGAACADNTDCSRPQHCFEGYCRDDDCPSGFECRAIQNVGPLAGKLYCVYKEGCGGSNRECEALGDMECRRLACFDKTLWPSDTADPDGAHELSCRAQNDLSFCQCADGTGSCSGEGLECTPPNHDPWPAGSVELRDVCMRAN